MQAFSMHFRVGTILPLVIAVAGCSQQPPNSSFSVIQPETIQVDGSDWTKEEWSKKLDAKVANHFRRSPQLADNPALSGEMVCYSNGSMQRIYWLSPVDNTCQWAMVEFKGGRGGGLVEGVGAPFVELMVREQ